MSLDRSTARSPHFGDSLEHLLAELERIDLLIRGRVARARAANDADSQFQGLYISEQEVDQLLSAPLGQPSWAAASQDFRLDEVTDGHECLAARVADRKARSRQAGVQLRLAALADLFSLSAFDIDTLLVCLAPELDLRYERLYAYLQDDVTKKRPSIDLALNLLCPSFAAKLGERERFLPKSPLRKYHLLQLFDDPSHTQPPLLGKYLRIDERIVGYLLGSDEVDRRIAPFARCLSAAAPGESWLLPDAVKARLRGVARPDDETGREPVIYLQGPYGVGKQLAAEALCAERGLRMVLVDGERLLAGEDLGGESFATATQLLVREGALQGAALYWGGFDGLLTEERRGWLAAVLGELNEGRVLAFLAGDMVWEPADALREARFARVVLPRPGYADRLQLWRAALREAAGGIDEPELKAVADKFRFTGGQIEDAAATARGLARWRDPAQGGITPAELYEACRLQSSRKLATLAQKITPHYCWTDIVLPADQLRQLREICNQVKYRAKVYGDWGFDRKLALGKGLNALFAGPSGTGKTMAADIMAGELGLELYKIDLSGVVSKYIGETEKNLSRIFAEAEASNAILFFDEADALFGKRSEVRDAHDRYANVEIAYLLQRMEEYDGVVILATNLQKNMDDAFVRRMHFTVSFPFPRELERRRIWEKIWPGATPRADELDLDFMARRFDLAGGNIRNIALAAAFLAADDGQVVDMRHLIRATQRELQKMGKVVVEGEFGEYGGFATWEA